MKKRYLLKHQHSKTPVALAPIERIGPAFPAFFLRLTEIESKY